MESIFIQLMYAYQFKNIDPYDWFCRPGSHIVSYNIIHKLSNNVAEGSGCLLSTFKHKFTDKKILTKDYNLHM